jgi:hypothetical protein
MDPRGRQELSRGTIKGSVEALIRTEGPVTQEQQTDLQAAGFRTHFAIDNVLGGEVQDTDRLADVAELPFVREIELSRPMFKE